MADETQAPDDEQQFSEWLDGLETEEDKVVAVAEREDKQAEKLKQAKSAEHAEEAVVTRTEYLTDKFLASASDQEKALFAIYSHGADSPRAMQAAIDLARTNAAEADRVKGVPVEEVEKEAETRAAQIAQSEYGVGPLSGGRASSVTPQEVFDSTLTKAHETKDTHLHYRLWADLPGSGEVSQPD